MTFPGDTRRARLGIVPIKIDGPAFVLVSRPGMRCECGGQAYVMLDVAGGGYSSGTTYDCAPTCRQIVCPHGVRWDFEDDSCESCEAEAEEARRADGEEEA